MEKPCLYHIYLKITLNMKYRLDRISRLMMEIDGLLQEGVDDRKIHDLVFNPDNWEINGYEGFLASVDKTPDKYKPFMTPHPYEEISQPEWKTFKLKGIDAGFALHYVGKGKVDICNVHNNSDIKGLSNAMLTFAKRQGGTMLDNYAGFLGKKYQENGFNKYDTYKWDEKFKPEGWRKDIFGEPDVEMRTHSSHDKKYDRKEGYRAHFDKKMNKAFPGHNVSEERLRYIIRESIRKIIG